MLSSEELDKLARLARLRLSTQERDELLPQLERIVGYVEKLQDVDVSVVDPMVHVAHNTAALRADRAQSVLGRAALEQAADVVDGMVRVPRVVE